MQDELSTGDLADVAGVPLTRIDDWVRAEILKPTAGGKGQGNHRRWTFMQALGIAVAVEIYEGRRGCCLQYVAEVVAAFGAMPEDELVAEFAAGNTHLSWLHQGRPRLRGPKIRVGEPDNPDWPDVAKLHRQISGAITRLSRRPANPTGRSRGLVKTT